MFPIFEKELESKIATVGYAAYLSSKLELERQAELAEQAQMERAAKAERERVEREKAISDAAAKAAFFLVWNPHKSKPKSLADAKRNLAVTGMRELSVHDEALLQDMWSGFESGHPLSSWMANHSFVDGKHVDQVVRMLRDSFLALSKTSV